MKYMVELWYQTSNGNPSARRYLVNAKDEISATKFAEVKIKRLKHFGKLHGGSAWLFKGDKP